MNIHTFVMNVKLTFQFTLMKRRPHHDGGFNTGV